MSQESTVIRSKSIEFNALMKNVYALLSIITAIAALSAFAATSMGMPRLPWWGVLIGFYGLLFLTEATKNSVAGLFSVATLAAFMGATLSPILHLIAANGMGNLIVVAFGATAVTFASLSAYAIITRKDFSKMGSFLFVGILVAFLMGIGSIVFNIPAMGLAVSAVFVLLMSGLVLYETSGMIHNPNQNYISVTVGLFVAIYNLFTSLLHLLMAFSGDD